MTSRNQSTKSIGILGTGSAVPERVLTNADLEAMVDTSDEWIVSRTGIRGVELPMKEWPPPIWLTGPP